MVCETSYGGSREVETCSKAIRATKVSDWKDFPREGELDRLTYGTPYKDVVDSSLVEVES